MTFRRAGIVGGLVLASLAVVLIVAVSVTLIMQRDRVLPNTTVGGKNLSGMTSTVAHATLQQLANDRRADVATFTIDDEEFALHPVEVGYALDVDASVAAAMSRGRSGNIGDIVERLRALAIQSDVAMQESWDETALDAWVANVADDLNRPVFHGDITINDETLAVDIRPPHDGLRVRTAKLHAQAVAALTSDGPHTFVLPADRTPALVREDDLRDVKDDAVRALEAPVLLTYDDIELEIEPETTARLIGVRRSAGDPWHTVELAVTPARVHLALDRTMTDRFASEPVDATYAINRPPPEQFDDQAATTFRPIEIDVPIDPGSPGTRFDVHLAAAQLTEMLTNGVREAELALHMIEPSLPTELAEELRPSHLLGTFTTYHQEGQARVHNIQRLADTINGTVLRPGEQFSVNGISGRRTCESGYLPAGTIVRGELVDTCGGGTSQFGTTTFNAAFFSGVQLDQWRPHSWYISRYPMGREATLNYPELDVKFTNNTDGVVVVMTSYTPSSITVSLYGQPLAQEVRATLGTPTNRREPSTTVRRTNDLYEDQERVIQTAGSAGFTVRVTRVIVGLDGSESIQTMDTTYLPQNRIVERGTRSRPDDDDD